MDAPKIQAQTFSFVDRHEQEIASIQRCCGVNHPSIVEPLNSLGLHYQFVVKDAEQSLRCHKEALRISFLAEAQAKERITAGIVLDQQATSTSADLKAIRKLHRSIATTLTDIGCAFMLKGDRDEAMRQFEEAMRVYRWMGLSVGHPRVAATVRCIRRIFPHYDETAAGLLPSTGQPPQPPSEESKISSSSNVELDVKTLSPKTIVPRSC